MHTQLSLAADSLVVECTGGNITDGNLLFAVSINGHFVLQHDLVCQRDEINIILSEHSARICLPWAFLEQLAEPLLSILPTSGTVLVAATFIHKETRLVSAMASKSIGVTKFNRQSRHQAQPATGNRRLITGTLQADRTEKHRWLFKFACHANADHILVLRVVFCDIHSCNNDTYVNWLPNGRQQTSKKRKRQPKGLVSSRECTYTLFLPKGSHEQHVGVDIGQSDASNERAIRYAVFANEFTAPVPSVWSTTAVPPANQHKRAVLVGVSKYRRPGISPLEFCDEDVAAWYKFLKSAGYTIELYGDEYSPYPVWHGPATVENVRAAVRRMVQTTTSNDNVVFVVSGHGSGNGSGDSHLCLLADPQGHDEKARSGQYWDVDIASDLRGPESNINRAKTFVFFDACFSGGIREELVAAVPHIFGTSTCTEDGYGYDSASVGHGAWTAQFLCEGLMSPAYCGAEKDVDLFELYMKSRALYIRKYPRRGDRPCFFAARDNKKWLGDDGPQGSPHGLFMLSECI